MLYKAIAKTTTLLAAALLSFQASAGLMLIKYEDNPTPGLIGGYAMTDFAVTNTGNIGSLTDSVNSPISGEVQFKKYSNDLDMTRDLADSPSATWWDNNEGSNYDIFKTYNNNRVELIMPENTRAFSFTVGSEFYSQGAWLEAIGTTGNIDRTYFTVGPGISPSFGVYADNNENGECGSITSIIIDPKYWGVGNFSINQSACAVPEPSSVALLGLGLIGLVSLRVRTAK